MADISIDIATLREAVEAVLTNLNERYGDSISLRSDYFWSIPFDQVYDVLNEPSELTIGQVSECVDSIENLAQDPSVFTQYSLVWLGEIFRAIGYDPPKL